MPPEMSFRPAFTLLAVEFLRPKQHGLRMCVLTWHGGVDVKKTVRIATLSAGLLALAGTASFALEEQKAPVAPQGTPEAAAQVQPGQSAPAAKTEGTEIRIPGLGKLGTLPKMDFGLELLYGATETEKSQEPSNIDDGQGDFTIRGSIKKNF